ncbi:MAG TPA: glycosyltransferase family 39 protein, partial [Candidatus Babeliales bacterium]|nr:glycosyltransferase family 39 protein [Candidatus Babeliales bacterium]
FNINTSFTWDEAVYLGLAESLAAGNEYGYIGNQNVESFRPPLFPVILSGLFYLFGSNISVAQTFVSVLYVALLLLLYFTVKNIYNKKISLLATLFLATNHLVIFFSNRIFVEMLSLLLVVLSFYLFVRMRKDVRFFIPFVATLVLAVLARYNLLAVAVIYLIYFLLFERSWFKKILTTQYFIVGILVALLIAYPFLDFAINSKDIISNSPQLKFEKFAFPTNYILYFWLLPLFFVPFFIFGVYRLFKTNKKSTWQKFSIFFIIAFLIANGIILSSFRYLIPILPFIALLIVPFFQQANKKIISLMLISFFLNLVAGYTVTYFFISPPQEFKQLPSFIEIRSYFAESLDRRNAALYVKDMTSENEIVMTNAYAWVWLYTHRDWVPIGSNEQEFLSNLELYGVKYIYSDGPLPDFVEDSVDVKKVWAGYADVYYVDSISSA